MQDKMLINFCKKIRTSETTLDALYKIFDADHPNRFTRQAFELGVLELRKRFAAEFTVKILRYAQEHGADSYDNFCKAYGVISQELWHMMVPKAVTTPKVEFTPEEMAESYYEKLMPLNWNMMGKTERIDFVKKIKHMGFQAYVMRKDKEVKAYISRIKPQKKTLDLYVTVFHVPSGPLSSDAKALLKSFVETLNVIGRGNFQYVECVNPEIIEVREVR